MEPVALRTMTTLDWIMPVVVAVVFILLVSLLQEPTRRRFMAIFVAGAGSAYLSGGFGVWEFPFVGVASWVAYRGLDDYRFIGIAWLMHTVWDVAHHLYGEPIIPFQPTSSAGCAITDALIAVWFFRGAPDILISAPSASALRAECSDGPRRPK
jgi:hypothetical protein